MSAASCRRSLTWLTRPDLPAGHCPPTGTKVTVFRGYSSGGRTVVPVQAVFSSASAESEAAKLAALLQ